MDEKVMHNREELEIDLKRLVTALLDKAWLIGVVAILCAVIAFAGTFFFITPTYQSSAMFYENNTDISVGGTNLSLTSGDISASRGLVDTYIVILNTRETLLDVLDYAEVDISYGKLHSMIQATDVSGTEVFRVTVTSTDPYEAEELANAIAHVLPKRISSIIEGSSAKVVDTAVVASAPSSPNYTKNTMLGLVVGLLLAAAAVVVVTLMDITIRTEEDITQSCKYPVLAAVPDMGVNELGGSYYGYGKKAQEKGRKSGRKTELVGGKISFAAAEAYKLLRTKLLFSFADEKNCRIIGISSALSGEGKSLSAVNLAYSLSQLGMRVLLVDCDMRRPTLSEKLPIQKSPGLSDFLAGQATADHLIQLCGIKDDEQAFHAMAPGRTPPNPMELLSSAKMEKMLTVLREKYDYIILDLPPVCEVGDALVASKLTDGMLMIARQNLCDRIVLNTAVRQLEFVDGKILGVVLNCAREEGAAYVRKYYKRYYRKRYSKYRYGTER